MQKVVLGSDPALFRRAFADRANSNSQMNLDTKRNPAGCFHHPSKKSGCGWPRERPPDRRGAGNCFAAPLIAVRRQLPAEACHPQAHHSPPPPPRRGKEGRRVASEGGQHSRWRAAGTLLGGPWRRQEAREGRAPGRCAGPQQRGFWLRRRPRHVARGKRRSCAPCHDVREARRTTGATDISAAVRSLGARPGRLYWSSLTGLRLARRIAGPLARASRQCGQADNGSCDGF